MESDERVSSAIEIARRRKGVPTHKPLSQGEKGLFDR
jgi:hypothetical protein